jgi:hypothetical protein
MEFVYNKTLQENATENATKNATENATKNATENITENATENITENATEKVLVLCHPKRYFTDISLKVVSMKILRKENIKDIELEFMSQPELYRLSDTEYMKSYEVNYRKDFDENLDINEMKGKYSLIIMNTCPFVYSPNLNNEIVVNKLTEILKPAGYIVFTVVPPKDDKKFYNNDVEHYNYVQIELYKRFYKKFFFDKFNIIDIPIEPNKTTTVQNNKLYDLNKSPLLRFRVFLLFQLKDINIKENNETSTARSSSKKTNNVRLMSTSARSNSVKNKKKKYIEDQVKIIKRIILHRL